MPTRTISGTILKPDGTAWEGGVVKFRLVRPFTTSSELYPTTTHSETLDSNGEFSTEIGVPDTGTAQYVVTTPDKNTYKLNISDGAAVTLETLIDLETIPGDTNETLAIINALTKLAIKNIDADYSVLSTDEYLRCTNDITVTLPAATGSGDVYFIANVGTGTITVAVTGSDTVNGTTPNVIPANTIAWYCDAESGNWDSNW